MLVWHTLNYRKSYSVFIPVNDVHNTWLKGICSWHVLCKWQAEHALCWFTKTDHTAGVVMGQITALVPRREWVSRLPDGCKRCGVVWALVRNRAVLVTSTEAREWKLPLNLTWNTQIFFYGIFSGVFSSLFTDLFYSKCHLWNLLSSLVLIKTSQAFYIYGLAYVGIVLFLYFLPLLHPVAKGFLREANFFFCLNLNIWVFYCFNGMFIFK